MNSDEIGSNDPKQSIENESFAAIVQLYWTPLFRLLHRLTGNPHDAEDLTQDTFLRALDRLQSFRPGTNMRAWLFRIATNAFFDLRRKRQTLKFRVLEDEPEHRGQRPEQVVESAELSEMLMAAIAELPEKARVVFLLRSQEDLSFREIAEIVGTSEETARWHMHQARGVLIARLNGKLQPDDRMP